MILMQMWRDASDTASWYAAWKVGQHSKLRYLPMLELRNDKRNWILGLITNDRACDGLEQRLHTEFLEVVFDSGANLGA
jgi:hypothetical protein